MILNPILKLLILFPSASTDPRVDEKWGGLQKSWTKMQRSNWGERVAGLENPITGTFKKRTWYVEAGDRKR